MPMRPPRICGCGCGKIIPAGQRCPSSLARKKEADARRPSARGERGYGTKWKKEREAFLKQHPTCIRCPSPATVVDHKVPHRGDQKLFWERTNWQPLCRTCHDRWKQSLERRT